MRLALALALLLPLAACDSGADSANGDCNAAFAANGTMTATAAGASFEAVCIAGSLTNGVLSLGGIENLGSAGATQRQINLNVPSAAVGTISLTPGLASYADVDDPANAAAGTYAGTGGTVTLEAVSATGASGSFSFSARTNAGATVQISGGAFDVTF